MGDDLDRIARTSAHSFDSWSDFATHADPANYPQDSVFENAVNAVITGDLATLDALPRANPELIHTRSARVHRVTLLQGATRLIRHTALAERPDRSPL